MWDTELLFTEYAGKYWLTWVPVDSSPKCLSVDWRWNYLARVLFDSSPGPLSVDLHWNYLDWGLVDLISMRLSFDRRLNYLARVPVVCPSTDAETTDSHPNRLSLDRRNL